MRELQNFELFASIGDYLFQDNWSNNWDKFGKVRETWKKVLRRGLIGLLWEDDRDLELQMHGKQVEHDIWDGKIKGSLSRWVRHEREVGGSCLLEDIEKNKFDIKKKKQSFKRKEGEGNWLRRMLNQQQQQQKPNSIIH